MIEFLMEYLKERIELDWFCIVELFKHWLVCLALYHILLFVIILPIQCIGVFLCMMFTDDRRKVYAKLSEQMHFERMNFNIWIRKFEK